MTTWFTSDQHFGHRNIIQYCQRPYLTVDEMDRDIIDRHNAVVGVDDVVVHVGDFSMKEYLVPQILPQLKGRHMLVMGNHDACWRSGLAKERYLKHGFFEVLDRWSFRGALVHHFPYSGTDHDQRYADHRPEDQGLTLIHGHVHNAWLRNGRQINVGVDVRDFYPVAERDL